MGYKRSQEHKRRLKKLSKESYRDWGGAYYDEEKKRYIRYSIHNKWLKTHCRRQTRRRINREATAHCKGCRYKKFYDYWWELL